MLTPQQRGQAGAHLKVRFFMGSYAWNAAGAKVSPNTTEPTFLKKPPQFHHTSGQSTYTR